MADLQRGGFYNPRRKRIFAKVSIESCEFRSTPPVDLPVASPGGRFGACGRRRIRHSLTLERPPSCGRDTPRSVATPRIAPGSSWSRPDPNTTLHAGLRSARTASPETPPMSDRRRTGFARSGCSRGTDSRPRPRRNIRRWLTEPPFARYRDRLVEDIEAGKLEGARRRLLRRPRVRHRRPARQDVPGRHQRPERADDRRERPRPGRLRHRARRGPTPRGRASSPATPGTTRPSSPALCARVLAAAGFKVYLFPEPRSTPLLSFAVRHLQCDAGIMITASHNPPSDNGFKCYAATGGQVIPPDDAGIIACVKAASDREIPEKPLRRGRRRRLDRPGRRRGRSSATSPPSSASRSATRATSRSSTRRCTASARPRSPRR